MAAARELLAAHLARLGYRVETQRFQFAPGTLRAFPLFGAGLGGLALAVTPLLVIPAIPAAAALVVWIAGLAALGAVAAGVGLGWTPAGEMREDANLIATRGSEPVRRWIVAHTDSKAQGHSMAGRLVAVWLAAGAVVAVAALGIVRLWGPPPGGVVAAGVGLALVAGIQAGRGRLRGGSRGARDNGSGLLAALVAAETASPGVGILLTGAEEFGLVGARILARTDPARLAGTEVVNVDTVDDEGNLYLVSHDPRGEALARALAPRLAAVGPPVRLRRLPLGIFVDSHPLARGGAAAVTIGRLTWRTLRRIHTAADTPDDLSLDTAERVGRAIAAN